MPYIDPEVINEAKKMDLLTYLQNYEPEELMRITDSEYSTRTHDSLKISNGKWCWFSRGIGGRSAVDYLIKVQGMNFTDAIEQIMQHTPFMPTVTLIENVPKEKPPFILPQKDISFSEVERYLIRRGINSSLIRDCAEKGMIFQTHNKGYVNAVFVGFDIDKLPRYATLRGTIGRFVGDVSGSDKRYSFALHSNSDKLHLFESAVDLLSYATLKNIRKTDEIVGSLLSLSGVYLPRKNTVDNKLPPALEQYLCDYTEIKHIYLHLDNDIGGRKATESIVSILSQRYEVKDEPPPYGKDYNDYLCSLLKTSILKNTERNQSR